jgi:hypothetical protein
VSGRSIIGALANRSATTTMIDSGAKAGATTYTSPTWAANAYDQVTLCGRLGSFNGGGVWQGFWSFQGIATNTFKSSYRYGSTTTGLSLAVIGTPGGNQASLFRDELNQAVERILDITWWPKMRYGKVSCYGLMASGDLYFFEGSAVSTDLVNPVTGVALNFSGNTLSFTDMMLVGTTF